MNIQKIILSGSTTGAPVLVTSTAMPGTTIHTAPNSGTDKDDLWLYASNLSAGNVTLTLAYSTVPTDIIIQTVPPQSGLYEIMTALPIQAGQVLRAFAGVASVINISGYAHRITGS